MAASAWLAGLQHFSHEHLGFTLFGVATGVGYWALHTSPARGEVTRERETTRSPLQHAA